MNDDETNDQAAEKNQADAAAAPAVDQQRDDAAATSDAGTDSANGEPTEANAGTNGAANETDQPKTATIEQPATEQPRPPTVVSAEVLERVARTVPAHLHVAQQLPGPTAGAELWAVCVSSNQIMAFRDTDGVNRLIAHDAEGNLFKCTEDELAAATLYPLH